MSIRSRLRRGCRWTVHPGLGQRLSDVQRLTAHATVLGAGHREIVGLGPGGFPLDVTDPGAGVRDGFPPHGRRPAMGVDLSWPLNWLVRPRPGGDDVR